jgi:Flp pilus assembly protein TadG
MCATEHPATPQRRKDLFRRFARSRKGVAMIEFGMVSIPFLGLLCAIFETAFVFFVHAAFDDAVSKTARAVATNQYTTAPATVEDFVAARPSGTGPTLCDNLPSIITCDYVYLNIQSFPPATPWAVINAQLNQTFYQASFNNKTTPYKSSTSLNAVSLGQAGYIVIFQAFYAMPVYLSVLVASGTNGARNFYAQSSNTVIQNTSGSFVHAIFSTAVFRNEP